MKKPAILKIHLPEPCSQDWNKMSPKANGRHCNSCDKIVVDFTQMNDDQLIDFFVYQKHKACGRFLPSQLDRAMLHRAPSKAKQYKRGFLASVLSILGFSAFAQNNSEIGKIQTEQSITIGEILPIDEITKFKGVVLYKNKGLSEVIIEVEGKKIQTRTDENGAFNLSIHKKSHDETLTIYFTHPSMAREKITLTHSKTDIIIEMAVAKLLKEHHTVEVIKPIHEPEVLAGVPMLEIDVEPKKPTVLGKVKE